MTELEGNAFVLFESAAIIVFWYGQKGWGNT